MTVWFTIRAAFISLTIAAFSAVTAHADIAAYNAAAARGDFVAAAAEAATIWPTFDKQSPSAVVVAREFAWSAMLGGRRPDAVTYARWLVEEGPRQSNPDPQPLTAMVLLRWAELGETPNNQQRQTLSDALKARAAQPDPTDRISMIAARELYMRGWEANDWRGVQRDAALTSTFAQALGKEGRLIRYRAEIDGIVATFLERRKPDSYIELTELGRRMLDDYGVDSYKPGADTPEMRLGYRLYTWGVAMQAYLVSLHNLVPDPHQQALRDTQKTLQKSLIPCNSAECPNAAPAGTAQVCAGRFDMTPKVTYPQSLLQRFEVGALLLALDTNDRGDVVEVRILASVPADGLEATVIPTVKKWRFVKAPKQRVDVCTLAQKNRMLTLEFMLGH